MMRQYIVRCRSAGVVDDLINAEMHINQSAEKLKSLQVVKIFFGILWFCGREEPGMFTIV